MTQIVESTLTLEEAIEMPEYAHLRELVHFMDNNPHEVIFPKKHEAALKRIVSEKVQTLFKENPNMPLKDVVTTILSSLSEEISSKLILRMTQRIIKEWENSSSTTLKNKAIAQLV